MPVTPTYPGVYIEEIPSGVRTIAGVATSVAAFVDFFRRGPMNRATQLFSFSDFERSFGGLDARSDASYAIQQFFLNGGTECWVVRVASGAPAAARGILQAAPAGATALTVDAASEGAWGNNLRVGVDYATTDVAARFNLTASEVATVGGRTVVVRQEVFRNLSMTSTDPQYVATIVNDASQLVRINGTPSGARPATTGTLGNTGIAFPVPAPAGGPIRVQVTFTIGAVTTVASANLGNGAIATIEEAAARLEAAVRNANPGRAEWAQATVRVTGTAATARLQVVGGPAAANAIITFAGAPADGPLVADPNSAGNLRLTNAAGAVENVASFHIGSTTAVGAQGAGTAGADGDPPDALALIGSNAVDPPTGMFALDRAPIFNILCLPRISRVSGTTTNFAVGQVGTVVSAATTYCEARRSMLVLDTPSSVTTVTGVRDWLGANATLRHRNLAFYFPRVMVADPQNDFRLRSFGASGTIAGLYARTDVTRGVWKAPAGTEATLRNVAALEAPLNDRENGALNPLAINCLRRFEIYGNVSWGARTLEGSDQQASEWKYVPVRRLALFLEESLYQGMQWVVFEPNDEPLWSQIRLNVGAFMHNLFRQGAFQGRTPQEAYFVKCDKETTTQTDINSGIVNIVVGFAPLKPAEFVIIKLQQIAGQIQT